MICGDCGSFLGRKVWHSTDKYRKIIYRCNNKYKDKKCESKSVTEDEIKDIFVKEFNKLNRAEAIRNTINLKEKLCDIKKLEKERFELNKEKDILIEKNNNLILQNSKKAMNQKLYKKKENAIMVPFEKLEGKLSIIEEKIKEKSDRCIILDDYIKNLKSATKITDFDEGLFCALVENVIVSKNDIKIRWKGEIEP